MREPVDAVERRQLCDLLVELGPDAPTLCAGWTTIDLAAHLVLREHFRRWGETRMAAEKARGMSVLIARLRAGAPLIPWRVPKVRTLLNGLEYFIHHEDVRRANGLGPRTDMPDVDDLCWRMSGLVGRGLAKTIRPFCLELACTSGASRTFGSGATATLSGPAPELVLFLSGRRSAAHVVLTGNDAAVAAVEQSKPKR